MPASDLDAIWSQPPAGGSRALDAIWGSGGSGGQGGAGASFPPASDAEALAPGARSRRYVVDDADNVLPDDPEGEIAKYDPHVYRQSYGKRVVDVAVDPARPDERPVALNRRREDGSYEPAYADQGPGAFKRAAMMVPKVAGAAMTLAAAPFEMAGDAATALAAKAGNAIADAAGYGATPAQRARIEEQAQEGTGHAITKGGIMAGAALAGLPSGAAIPAAVAGQVVPMLYDPADVRAQKAAYAPLEEAQKELDAATTPEARIVAQTKLDAARASVTAYEKQRSLVPGDPGYVEPSWGEVAKNIVTDPNVLGSALLAHGAAHGVREGAKPSGLRTEESRNAARMDAEQAAARARGFEQARAAGAQSVPTPPVVREQEPSPLDRIWGPQTPAPPPAPRAPSLDPALGGRQARILGAIAEQEGRGGVSADDTGTFLQPPLDQRIDPETGEPYVPPVAPEAAPSRPPEEPPAAAPVAAPAPPEPPGLLQRIAGPSRRILDLEGQARDLGWAVNEPAKFAPAAVADTEATPAPAAAAPPPHVAAVQGAVAAAEEVRRGIETRKAATKLAKARADAAADQAARSAAAAPPPADVAPEPVSGQAPPAAPTVVRAALKGGEATAAQLPDGRWRAFWNSKPGPRSLGFMTRDYATEAEARAAIASSGFKVKESPAREAQVPPASPAAPVDPRLAAFAEDIPRETAVRAHSGTSMTPEKRGDALRAEYAQSLARDYERFREQAEKGGTLDQLDAIFDRYRQGLKERTNAYLASRQGLLSSGISGPSNFPVRRQQKMNAREQAHATALHDWHEQALKAAIRDLRPDLAPIRTEDADAGARLADEIQKATDLQERMKAANAAIRKSAAAGPDAQRAALQALGFSEKHAHELLKPDFTGRVGFADWQLTNNSANIRRLRDRVTAVETAKATPQAEHAGARGRVEDDPPGNRVRVFTPEKPSEEVRAKLKANGFRWSPQQGAWSAYRNEKALRVAREVAGVEESIPQAPPGAPSPPSPAAPPADTPVTAGPPAPASRDADIQHVLDASERLTAARTEPFRKDTGERVSRSVRDSTTHGTRFPTREAWEAARAESLAKQRADFEARLREMSPEDLASQVAHWTGEEAKAARLAGPKKAEPAAPAFPIKPAEPSPSRGTPLPPEFHDTPATTPTVYIHQDFARGGGTHWTIDGSDQKFYSERKARAAADDVGRARRAAEPATPTAATPDQIAAAAAEVVRLKAHANEQRASGMPATAGETDRKIATLLEKFTPLEQDAVFREASRPRLPITPAESAPARLPFGPREEAPPSASQPIVDANGRKYTYHVATIPTEDVLTSHDTSGRPRPGYRSEFQARDFDIARARAIAKDFDPDQIRPEGASPTIGAPVAWTDPTTGKAQVIAGNHREVARQIARPGEPATLRILDGSLEDAQRLAAASQQSTAAPERLVEKARAAVRALSIEPKDLKAVLDGEPVNRENIDRFLAKNPALREKLFRGEIPDGDAAREAGAAKINEALVGLLPEPVQHVLAHVGEKAERAIAASAPALLHLAQLARAGAVRPEYDLLPSFERAARAFEDFAGKGKSARDLIVSLSDDANRTGMFAGVADAAKGLTKQDAGIVAWLSSLEGHKDPAASAAEGFARLADKAREDLPSQHVLFGAEARDPLGAIRALAGAKITQAAEKFREAPPLAGGAATPRPTTTNRPGERGAALTSHVIGAGVGAAAGLPFGPAGVAGGAIAGGLLAGPVEGLVKGIPDAFRRVRERAGSFSNAFRYHPELSKFAGSAPGISLADDWSLLKNGERNAQSIGTNEVHYVVAPLLEEAAARKVDPRTLADEAAKYLNAKDELARRATGITAFEGGRTAADAHADIAAATGALGAPLLDEVARRYKEVTDRSLGKMKTAGRIDPAFAGRADYVPHMVMEFDREQGGLGGRRAATDFTPGSSKQALGSDRAIERDAFRALARHAQEAEVSLARHEFIEKVRAAHGKPGPAAPGDAYYSFGGPGEGRMTVVDSKGQPMSPLRGGEVLLERELAEGLQKANEKPHNNEIANALGWINKLSVNLALNAPVPNVKFHARVTVGHIANMLHNVPPWRWPEYAAKVAQHGAQIVRELGKEGRGEGVSPVLDDLRKRGLLGSDVTQMLDTMDERHVVSDATLPVKLRSDAAQGWETLKRWTGQKAMQAFSNVREGAFKAAASEIYQSLGASKERADAWARRVEGNFGRVSQAEAALAPVTQFLKFFTTLTSRVTRDIATDPVSGKASLRGIAYGPAPLLLGAGGAIYLINHRNPEAAEAAKHAGPGTIIGPKREDGTFLEIEADEPLNFVTAMATAPFRENGIGNLGRVVAGRVQPLVKVVPEALTGVNVDTGNPIESDTVKDMSTSQQHERNAARGGLPFVGPKTQHFLQRLTGHALGDVAQLSRPDTSAGDKALAFTGIVKRLDPVAAASGEASGVRESRVRAVEDAIESQDPAAIAKAMDAAKEASALSGIRPAMRTAARATAMDRTFGASGASDVGFLRRAGPVPGSDAVLTGLQRRGAPAAGSPAPVARAASPAARPDGAATDQTALFRRAFQAALSRDLSGFKAALEEIAQRGLAGKFQALFRGARPAA